MDLDDLPQNVQDAFKNMMMQDGKEMYLDKLKEQMLDVNGETEMDNYQ